MKTTIFIVYSRYLWIRYPCMCMSSQAAEPELEFHYFEASLYLGSVNVSCFFLLPKKNLIVLWKICYLDSQVFEVDHRLANNGKVVGPLWRTMIKKQRNMVAGSAENRNKWAIELSGLFSFAYDIDRNALRRKRTSKTVQDAHNKFLLLYLYTFCARVII